MTIIGNIAVNTIDNAITVHPLLIAPLIFQMGRRLRVLPFGGQLTKRCLLLNKEIYGNLVL